MNSPDTALINSLITPSALSLILHFKGGASHGITSLANYAELERRLGFPLLSMNPFICADSVGADAAIVVAAPSQADPSKPRYSSTSYLQIYADHVVNLLSPNTALAASTLRAIAGDYKMKDALTPLHISAAELTEDDIDLVFFRSYPENFRLAYPDMKLEEEYGVDIEAWKAAMASSSSLLHRGSFPIEIDGVTRKFTDIALLELHAHLVQHKDNFRDAYPDGTLIKINLGNNYYSTDVPDRRLGKAWAARKGVELARRLQQKQQERLHEGLVTTLIDLSLVVPRGKTIPPAFSNRPEDINGVMAWTEEMIASPGHQAKLDVAAEVILAARDLSVPDIGPALTWPTPIPVPESRVKPFMRAGGEFVRAATPVVRSTASSVLTPAVSWMGHQWKDTVVPWLRHQMESGTNKLLPPRQRYSASEPIATQPLRIRSSEQRTPSESDYTPL